MSEIEPVDVLLLVHSPDEMVALLDDVVLPEHRRPLALAGGWRFYRSFWETNWARISYALVSLSADATTEPVTKTHHFVKALRPRCVVSCGAAWRAPDTGVCTVIAARSISFFDQRGREIFVIDSPSLDGSKLPGLGASLEDYALDGVWARRERKRTSLAVNARSDSIAFTDEVDFDGKMRGLSRFASVNYGITFSQLVQASFGVPFVVVRGVPGGVALEIDSSAEEAACLAASFALSFLADALQQAPVTQSAPPSTPRTVNIPGLREQLQKATLEHLQLRNFKNVEELSLDLAHGSDLPGRWTCLAGVNGAGKSAVLQALTLALLGPRFATELGGAWLQRMRRIHNGAPTNATLQATLRVEGRDLRFELPITDRGASLEALSNPLERISMEPLWDARAEHHLLLAYGPGRNLSEHIDSRHDSKSVEVRRVITLFDPLAQVASAEAILRERNDAPSVIAMARKLLGRVLEGMPVTVAEDGASLRFRMGDVVVPAVDLPDGFRATIAWLVDLCASWHTIAPETAKQGDPAAIEALVILDEIDLHLHPKLQRVLVPRLRETLPRVQWIVSTHSPLVLGSFDRREIVMLQSDERGRVSRRVIDRQVMGFTTDEIYEWLMETTPRSAALESYTASLGESEAAEARAKLLALSPELDEDDVREAYELRAQRAKQSQQTVVRDDAVPSEEEPET